MKTETFETFDELTKRIEEAKKENLKIKDIFSIYPIEDFNHFTVKRQKLNTVALIGGFLGFLLAIGMQYYIHSNWLLNFGNKPNMPFPSFFFVTFEITILLAIFSVSIFFFAKSKLYKKSHNQDNFSIIFE